MTASRSILTVALVAFASMILVGCGSDDGDAAGPATDIEIVLDSFSFDPADVTVVADTEVALTVLNVDGALPHNWAVIAPGSEIDDERDLEVDDILFDVGEVGPQRSAQESFSVGAGQYQVICTVPGHFSAGMRGTLTAVAGSDT
jgi:uncharacterized cupredoxin-like copper-binding protein